MKVLVIGGSGQVGQALIAAAPTSLKMVAPRRAEADLTQPETIESALACRPAIVVNTAAYTAVDKAEDEPAAAFAVNRDGPGDLARLCRDAGVPLIHLSTDYVFDGAKATPYIESDAASPLNVYGRSKLAGEIAVRETCARHIILRSSWVFGPHGANFVRGVLMRACRGEGLRVVDDQHGCPTSAAAIASAVIKIVKHIEAGGDVPWGTYHYSGREPTTWFGFAKVILSLAHSWLESVPPLAPIASSEYPGRARRPANSILDCSLITRELGITTEPWTAALADTVAELGTVMAPKRRADRLSH